MTWRADSSAADPALVLRAAVVARQSTTDVTGAIRVLLGADGDRPTGAYQPLAPVPTEAVDVIDPDDDSLRSRFWMGFVRRLGESLTPDTLGPTDIAAPGPGYYRRGDENQPILVDVESPAGFLDTTTDHADPPWPDDDVKIQPDPYLAKAATNAPAAAALVGGRRLELLADAMARHLVPDAEVDVEALCVVVAKGGPVMDVPARHRWALRQRIAMVIDDSDPMDIFAQDALDLLRAVRRATGSSEVIGFRAGSLPASLVRRLTTYDLILVWSDLGLGPSPLSRSPGVAWWRWQEFRRSMRSLRIPLIVVTPFHFTDDLAGTTGRVISWSERTEVRDVRKARNAGTVRG